MSERKYSLSEIDRMRTAVGFLCSYGVRTPAEAAACEDRLRTYMANGTDPEELERAADEARGYSLTQAAGPLSIAGKPVTKAYVGQPYPGFKVTASGGQGRHEYFVRAPPPWLSLNKEGEFFQSALTPLTAGKWGRIEVGVKDAAGSWATLAPFDVEVLPAEA